MKKTKPVIVRNAHELSRALGLGSSDSAELEIRSQINDTIIDAVKKSGLTHAQVAKLARTSRTRLTAVLNRDRSHVSTDLMLRLLHVLGYRARMSFRRVRSAA